MVPVKREREDREVRIVLIGNTFGTQKEIRMPKEGGDLLIFCGGISMGSKRCIPEFFEFIDWLIAQKYTHKVFCFNSADYLTSLRAVGGIQYTELYNARKKGQKLLEEHDIEMLAYSDVTAGGVRITPQLWATNMYGAEALCYTMSRESIENNFERNVIKPNQESRYYMNPTPDIMITSMPAFGILDYDPLGNTYPGSPKLRELMANPEFPRIHVSTLNYNTYGVEQTEVGVSINPSIFCNGIMNLPIIVDYNLKTKSFNILTDG